MHAGPRKGKPIGGFVAIVAIVILECVFLHFTEPLTGLPFLEPTADDATVVAKRALFDQAGGSVVLIGDSSCLMGLIPSVIEGESGLRVVNLGLLASYAMAGFAETIEELLERPKLPTAVVVAVLPRALEFTEADARQFALLGRALVAYGESSPAYAKKIGDWRSWFHRKHVINRFPRGLGGSFAAYSRTLSASKGYSEESHVYGGGEPVRRDFQATPFATESLRRLVRSAEAKKVPVFLWWSPSPIDAVDPAYLKDAHAAAQGLQRELPWLQILQDEPPAWETSLFGSVTHVIKNGAIRNSERLGHALASAGRKGTSRVSRRTDEP